MIKSDIKNEHTKKAIFTMIIIFIIFWVGMNLSIVFGEVRINYDNITDMIRDKYQNCIQMLGMIVPIVYSLAFYGMFTFDEKHIIVRYGKRRYGKLQTHNITFFSVIFAVQYMLIDLIFMSIFSDISVLINSFYYVFMLLKFIMLVLFLNLIGMTLYSLKNILSCSSIYVVIGSMLYVLWTGLYYVIYTESSPAFYMNFAESWFLEHTFDTMTYIINLAKLMVASLILKYIGQIVFLKRDIIGNEEN